MSKDNCIKMKQRYLDIKSGHELESHAETVYDFQSQRDNTLIMFHLENLIQTYGIEAVKYTSKKKLNLINSRRKLKQAS